MRSFKVQAGEPIKLTFMNPDSVPHNWALIKPGTLTRVGDLVTRSSPSPTRPAATTFPGRAMCSVYTDIVVPQDQFTISFRAPSAPGRYPYLCTFPATGWS